MTDEAADGLRVERRGAVALITIDRPSARNSLTFAGHAELVRLWAEAQGDPEIRAVVVTGAADPSSPPERQAFCVGSDRDELGSLLEGGTAATTSPDPGTLATVDARTPVIAAINGYCIGAGLTMALAADLRVASPMATFGLPELALGSIPGNGGIRQAMRTLPRSAVMELLLLPERMTARRAMELGLLNAIVAAADLLPTALRWAEHVASLPVRPVSAALELVAASPGLMPAEVGELEGRLMRHVHDSARSPPD